MKKNTLFIHSFFRSGSTYIYHAFRRSENNNYCYQEPLNEYVIQSVDQPDALMDLKGDGDMQRRLKHPNIGRPYFAEVFDTYEAWKSIVTPEISYDDYFGLQTPDKTNAYLDALINAPDQENIVIQTCRTGARIGNIKDGLGGYHVSLWRNPWDQWWSCKSTEYFENIPQVIASAAKIHPVIKSVCDAAGIAILPHHPFGQQMRHFEQRWVKPQSSYMLFFTLWCLNMLEGQKRADLILSIDRLSRHKPYRDTVLKTFSEIGFSKLDFSDCDIPQSIFTSKDAEFFRPLEEKVYEYLLETGAADMDVKALRETCQNSTPVFNDIQSLSSHSQEYVKTIASLRAMVLMGQEGREREGAHSNTHIANLNAQLIDLKNEQLQAGGNNSELKSLNAQLEQANAAAQGQITTYEKLLHEQLESVKSLSQAVAETSKHKETLFSNLNLTQTQLKHEQEHHGRLEAEHESLLEFFAGYEQETQGEIEQHIHANKTLKVSLEDVANQINASEGAAQLLETQLLAQIHKHEAAMQSVMQSTSWRVTKPMRLLGELRNGFKKIIKASLRRLLPFIRSSRLLKVCAKVLIVLVPSLRARAEAFSAANPRSAMPVKSTAWKLQLDENATKLWVSALKKEDET